MPLTSSPTSGGKNLLPLEGGSNALDKLGALKYEKGGTLRNNTCQKYKNKRGPGQKKNDLGAGTRWCKECRGCLLVRGVVTVVKLKRNGSALQNVTVRTVKEVKKGDQAQNRERCNKLEKESVSVTLLWGQIDVQEGVGVGKQKNAKVPHRRTRAENCILSLGVGPKRVRGGKGGGGPKPTKNVPQHSRERLKN